MKICGDGVTKLLREPLLHFLFLGAFLFSTHAILRTGEKETPLVSIVRITSADADWLREMWVRQWGRPPTDEELTSLVADHLKEEVLAREAKALELDVGDTIIRRRLAQKMAFLLDDTIQIAEPPEVELRALYAKRPDIAMTSARVSFTQVFFRRELGDSRARSGLVALSGDTMVSQGQGDRLPLGETFVDQDEQALTTLFGSTFAQTVIHLPAERWSGPIESSYGLHLVKVTAVSPPQARPFAEVRDRLVEEWRRERQEAARVQLFRSLMQKYRVTADPAVQPFLAPLTDQAEVRP